MSSIVIIHLSTQNLLAHAPTAIHVISAFYGFNRYMANFRKYLESK